MGAGTRHQILSELLRREKEAGIKPNPRIRKEAAAMTCQDTSLITENILKVCHFYCFYRSNLFP